MFNSNSLWLKKTNKLEFGLQMHNWAKSPTTRPRGLIAHDTNQSQGMLPHLLGQVHSVRDRV